MGGHMENLEKGRRAEEIGRQEGLIREQIT
jgi:hypothetical protein